jgi:hypothetical protein
MVVPSTRRMPKLPIRRLVSGPLMAWPTLVAASTMPAAAYESKMWFMCSRNPSEIMPLGNRAVSCAAMIRATPGVRSRST